MPQVLLLGASGGMGRRIAALWESEVPGVPLRLGVRRQEAIKHLAPCTQAVVARLDEPASLRTALSGVAVVINAIGPYTYDPAPVLDICLEMGAHYVDLASEPEYLSAVHSWVGNREARIAVCPGASTVPGLVELSAVHLTDRLGARPAAFEVFLSMGSANRLTPGLLSSLTLQLGMPLRSLEDGVSYRQLRRRTLHGLDTRLFGRYPSPFDIQGLDTGKGFIPTRFWVGLDRRWIVCALWCLSYLRPRFNDRIWIKLTEKVRPLVGLANLVGGWAGGLRIEALDSAGSVMGSVNYFAPKEGLNIPALPSIWAARALLDSDKPGIRPLRNLVTFNRVEISVRSRGYEVLVDL